MRLIDADPLLEQMKHRKEYVGRPSDPVCLVEDAPTVDSWTRVGDGMPKYEGDYLVTDGHHVPWKCRMLILAGTKGWVNGAHNPPIKYWMPMPELPKGNEVNA